MRTSTPRLAAVLLCVLVLGSQDSQAATFCVSDGTQLQAALNTAAGNGEADVIRLRSGTYTRAGGAVAFSYFSSQNQSLTLEGGWFGLSPGNCALRIDQPTGTVLNGEGARSVLQLLGNSGSNGALTLRNLSIANGSSNDTGGAVVGGIGGYLGSILIERVIFRGNTGGVVGGLSASTDGGVLQLINSLFDDNACSGGVCAASLVVNNEPFFSAQPRLRLWGNTFVRGDCASGSCRALRLGGGFGGAVQFEVANSVFALNQGADIDFAINTGSLRHSRLDSLIGTPQNSSGNLASGVAPGFVDEAGGDFRLAPGSALIDAGTASALLPETDLDNLPRVSGSAPDIGAYERQGPLFANGFESAQ